MKSFTLQTKFFIVLGLIAVVGFSVLAWQALGGGATVQTVDESSLVAHWTFDNGDMGPNVRDISGNGNHGNFVHGGSGTTTTSGARGEALEFDGNDTVDLNTPLLDDATDFSVAFWVNVDNYGAKAFRLMNQCGLGLGCISTNMFSINVGSTGSLSVEMSPGSTYTTFSGGGDGTIPTDKWTHVVFTRSGATARFYVDTINTGSKTDVNTGALNATLDFVFTNKEANSVYLDGQIDDVRIYSEALSEAEIKRLYEFGAQKRNLSRSPGTLADGLVGHWTFDAGDMVNNVADVSGNDNNGTLNGQTSTTTAIGKIGQALEFDGVDDYVDTNSTMDVSSITVSAWIKRGNSSDRQIIIAKHDSPHTEGDWVLSLFDHGSALLLWAIYDEGSFKNSFTSNEPEVGVWAHIVGTYDGETMRLYKDGVEVESAQHTGSIDSASNDEIWIGRRPYSGAEDEFLGEIDDVRIYNRALSADEVNRLYHLGATTKINQSVSSPSSDLSTGLVGHWTFDARDLVPNVRDISGQGNHGALQGQTSTTTAIGKIGQALEFDGVDDYVDIGDNTYTDADVESGTIAGWVKVNNSGGTQSFFDFEGYAGRQISSSKFQARIYDGAHKFAGDTENIIIDKWYHYAQTWDGSTLRLYVNGKEKNSTAAGSPTPDSTNRPVRMGSSYAGLEDFDGQIDDVRIYNRALSADEVSRLYEMGR